MDDKDTRSISFTKEGITEASNELTEIFKKYNISEKEQVTIFGVIQGFSLFQLFHKQGPFYKSYKDLNKYSKNVTQNTDFRLLDQQIELELVVTKKKQS